MCARFTRRPSALQLGFGCGRFCAVVCSKCPRLRGKGISYAPLPEEIEAESSCVSMKHVFFPAPFKPPLRPRQGLSFSVFRKHHDINKWRSTLTRPQMTGSWSVGEQQGGILCLVLKSSEGFCHEGYLGVCWDEKVDALLQSRREKQVSADWAVVVR